VFQHAIIAVLDGNPVSSVECSFCKHSRSHICHNIH